MQDTIREKRSLPRRDQIPRPPESVMALIPKGHVAVMTSAVVLTAAIAVWMRSAQEEALSIMVPDGEDPFSGLDLEAIRGAVSAARRSMDGESDTEILGAIGIALEHLRRNGYSVEMGEGNGPRGN